MWVHTGWVQKENLKLARTQLKTDQQDAGSCVLCWQYVRIVAANKSRWILQAPHVNLNGFDVQYSAWCGLGKHRQGIWSDILFLFARKDGKVAAVAEINTMWCIPYKHTVVNISEGHAYRTSASYFRYATFGSPYFLDVLRPCFLASNFSEIRCWMIITRIQLNWIFIGVGLGSRSMAYNEITYRNSRTSTIL